LSQQLGGLHDHPGRAETTLKGCPLKERLLKHRDASVGLGRIDGFDLGPMRLRGKHQTSPYNTAIDGDIAGPAHTVFAANVTSGQTETVPKEINQGLTRRYLSRQTPAIHRQLDGYGLVIHP
jgi:hypothetical protein